MARLFYAEKCILAGIVSLLSGLCKTFSSFIIFVSSNPLLLGQSASFEVRCSIEDVLSANYCSNLMTEPRVNRAAWVSTQEGVLNIYVHNVQTGQTIKLINSLINNPAAQPTEQFMARSFEVNFNWSPNGSKRTFSLRNT